MSLEFDKQPEMPLEMRNANAQGGPLIDIHIQLTQRHLDMIARELSWTSVFAACGMDEAKGCDYVCLLVLYKAGWRPKAK
jgi:hypothetical protein